MECIDFTPGGKERQELRRENRKIVLAGILAASLTSGLSFVGGNCAAYNDAKQRIDAQELSVAKIGEIKTKIEKERYYYDGKTDVTSLMRAFYWPARHYILNYLQERESKLPGEN
jgi:hypothetical protein